MLDATDQAETYLQRARDGAYGTPENQRRDSTPYRVFWLCFEGTRRPAEYKGTNMHPVAIAGAAYRKEHDQSASSS